MSKPYQNNILIVEENNAFSSGLKQALEAYGYINCVIETVETAEEAEKILHHNRKKYNLVISDLALPGKSGFDLFQFLNESAPDTKQVLLTADNPQDYYDEAKRLKLYHIYNKEHSFQYENFIRTIKGILSPDFAWGIHNYLQNDTHIKEFKLCSTDDIIARQAEIEQYLNAFNNPGISFLTVAIVEAMTNSVYHAMKTAGGEDLYGKHAVVDYLDEAHQVSMSYGHDSDKVVVSIQDQGGTLDPDMFIAFLKKNADPVLALEDEGGGRGLYLMQMLSDQLVVNIASGKSTEFVMIKWFNDATDNSKPLLINYIQSETINNEQQNLQKTYPNGL